MKIIAVDNFDCERRSDRLICDNVDGYWGKKIVEFLNKDYSGPNSQDYFRCVSDDYHLHTFTP